MSLVLWLGLLFAQDAKKPKVDQEKVDAAIENGVKYLRSQMELIINREIYLSWERSNQGSFHQKMTELVLLTFIHAGVKDDDPDYKKMLDSILASSLDTTYRAALQAMVLSKIDAKKYQARIAQCGQMLVDSQCQDGKWCYGHRSDTPVPAAKEVQTKGKDTAVLPRITLQKAKPGCPQGDLSNAQYAALGLRACMESGVIIPPDVLMKAKQAWERTQRNDGAWDYDRPKGTRQQDQPAGTYGSMTVGGVAALCILKHYLREPAKGDNRIVGAMNWLAKNFTVSENPGYKHHQYYYLYGMERAGDLYGTETFVNREWYVEGATWLIANQKPDGMWWSGSQLENQVVATCFAILFLRRATAPLPKIATGTGR
jgi:predicted SprT family Zn-dependent metalloprotease